MGSCNWSIGRYICTWAENCFSFSNNFFLQLLIIYIFFYFAIKFKFYDRIGTRFAYGDIVRLSSVVTRVKTKCLDH